MKALQRPGRTAAVVGAVVAVSATTLMALTGIASASVPGTCTDTVNIREEPSIDSRIVALCEAGTAVQTGPTRDGFVQITDLGGWAAQEYIAFDDEDELAEPTTPDSPTPPSTGPEEPGTSTAGPSVDEPAGPSTTPTADPADADPADADPADADPDDGVLDEGDIDDASENAEDLDDGSTGGLGGLFG